MTGVLVKRKHAELLTRVARFWMQNRGGAPLVVDAVKAVEAALIRAGYPVTAEPDFPPREPLEWRRRLRQRERAR